ncbi:MAG: hypothetical protein ABUS48_05295 [Pseudomonadota bacterium]
MRIFATAIAICAVSFVVDVAGDLAVGHRHVAADAAQAASARVELPPHLIGAVRAHPLPVRHHLRRHRHTQQAATEERAHKPRAHSVKSAPKQPFEGAPKPHSRKVEAEKA